MFFKSIAIGLMALAVSSAALAEDTWVTTSESSVAKWQVRNGSIRWFTINGSAVPRGIGGTVAMHNKEEKHYGIR